LEIRTNKPPVEPAVSKNRVIKRKWGDRKDGVWLRDIDPLHAIQPYIMPNRTDCEAFVVEKVDITNIQEYLKKKNAENPNAKYSIFHCVAAAIVKTVMLRPKMNRFVQGYRTYQRNELSIAFVAKKAMGDHGEEALMMMSFNEDDNIDTIHDRIVNEVHAVRKDEQVNNSTVQMNFFSRIPRFIMRPIMAFIRMLDFYGKVPNALIKDDYYQYTYKSVSELVKGLSQQNKLLHIAVCALFFTSGAVILGNSFVNVFPHITLPPIFKKKQRGATRVVKQRVISK
jgi:hypothetical protein